MWTQRWLMALALLVATAGGAAAQAGAKDGAQGGAKDRRGATGAAERQVRGETAAKEFVQGRYDEALKIYLDLYVQSGGRPEYLRNIGRCQQKLKQYDRAIESLKDYLQRARNLSAAERTEVQGFISEMEAARANQATSAPPPLSPAAAAAPAPSGQPAPSAAPPPPSVTATPSPAPIAVAPTPSPVGSSEATPAQAAQPLPPPSDPASQTGTAPVLISQTPAPANQSTPTSGLKIGGIVALIGAGLLAVGGTAMLLSARSTYEEAKTAGCPTASAMMCDQKANSVKSSNQISQVLYIAAGVAGAGGVTMLILAPGPSPESRVSLGARFTF